MTIAIIAPAASVMHDQASNEGNEMDPNKIDLTGAERIAFASSGGDDKDRWTELAVWRLPDSFRQRRWLAESIGKSRLRGETDRRRVLHVGSLERACKLFEDSDLGRIVIAEAEDWLEENGAALAAFPRHTTEPAWAKGEGETLVRAGEVTTVDQLDLPQSDEEALTWLYGQPDANNKGYAQMLAKDFGIGESTTRAALKNGTPVKVPLLAVLKWFDREQFRRDREALRKGDVA